MTEGAEESEKDERHIDEVGAGEGHVVTGIPSDYRIPNCDESSVLLYRILSDKISTCVQMDISLLTTARFTS